MDSKQIIILLLLTDLVGAYVTEEQSNNTFVTFDERCILNSRETVLTCGMDSGLMYVSCSTLRRIRRIVLRSCAPTFDRRTPTTVCFGHAITVKCLNDEPNDNIQYIGDDVDIVKIAEHSTFHVQSASIGAAAVFIALLLMLVIIGLYRSRYRRREAHCVNAVIVESDTSATTTSTTSTGTIHTYCEHL